jgi:uncharacterized protein involved in tolerance to divalent cations
MTSRENISEANIGDSDVFRKSMMNSGYYWKGDIEKRLKVSSILKIQALTPVRKDQARRQVSQRS